MKPTWFIFISFLFKSFIGLSQCTCPVVPFPSAPMPGDCNPVSLTEGIVSTATNSANVDFTFDTFGKIQGGISLSGSTLLRLNVPAKVLGGPCKWGLYMYVDNGNSTGGLDYDGVPTPVSKWRTLASYGVGGNRPDLDLLEVKVYNWCGTPCNTGIPQFFNPTDLSCIPIIHDVVTNVAGPCIPNVNGAGSYITNYNEFSFTVDYRIYPNFALSLRPGQYTVKIHFYLVEE